jgi:GMP synthase-like glutamine amidotransferase
VIPLASNEVLEAQAFKVTGTPFYSTQFHPDLLAKEARARYLAYQSTMNSRTQREEDDGELFVPGMDDASSLLGAFATYYGLVNK